MVPRGVEFEPNPITGAPPVRIDEQCRLLYPPQDFADTEEWRREWKRDVT